MRTTSRLAGRRACAAMATAVISLGLSGCVKPSDDATRVPLPNIATIPAGQFIQGSDNTEREVAYDLDARAYGSPLTRQAQWYSAELPRHSAQTDTYAIMRTPVTNRQYAAFIRATRYRSPDVTEPLWRSYGLIHPYSATRRHAWKGAVFPFGRGDHPVVLVSHSDATSYAQWLSMQTGETWRLPTEAEWEKAARGTDGHYFPWGDTFDASKLNSHDAGPFDTQPVGRYPAGASPFSLLDAAGQVFEWTADTTDDGRAIVKGGSWDDRGCGVCRPAARHARPLALQHILIGFRLVREIPRQR